VAHSQLASLQVADAVAFSLLLPACYRHKSALLDYGLKFCPGDYATLKKENPQLLAFAEGLN